MRHGRKIGLSVSASAVLLLLVALGGCNDESPTSTGLSDVTLSAAEISVNDQSLDGQTIHQGEYVGPVRYDARLVDHQGNPVAGGRVLVQIETSGMMGPMHGYTGQINCYDDGTHGDLVPGDGAYCFVDSTQQYGCHRMGAQSGEYHYDFCGYDPQGHESNHMNLSVSLQQ